MQKFQANNGFTLIELIVVLSLVSVMLFVATPRFSDFLFGDDTDTTLRWLMIKIRDVKQRSVAEQKDYVLNLDFENNRMWMTDESLETDEDLAKASDKGYSLPEGLHLLDVEYFGKGRLSLGIAPLLFSRQGYSDRAIIHLSRSDETPLSVLIEPFLPDVITEHEYLSYRSDE